MNAASDLKAPLRILIYALGGEGGGVLMNWIVAAARAAEHQVQATSVPGVAQRTGSTTYYIEVAEPGQAAVFNLVPMPGRVDVLVASELVEAGRALETGYVSPDLTTLIASTSRTFTTAEKMALGDGRYGSDRIIAAGEALSKRADLRDFTAMAEEEGTYISAVLFGALAGSGALPWPIETSRGVVTGAASLAGFDRASEAETIFDAETVTDLALPTMAAQVDTSAVQEIGLPEAALLVAALGHARCVDYQDIDYGQLYLDRLQVLATKAGPDHDHALTEAARRLALWMCYEDVARVADLKTRPERMEKIRSEARATPDQVLRVTEHLKPRIEEIADILPKHWGTRLMARAEAGKSLPFLGKGRLVHTTGPVGYRLLRILAHGARFRRGSLRYDIEQREINEWLDLLAGSLAGPRAFAEALAELPRLRKGYSDTAQRGVSAYRRIMESLVLPAVADGNEEKNAPILRQAVAAAMSDETHSALGKLLDDLEEDRQ